MSDFLIFSWSSPNIPALQEVWDSSEIISYVLFYFLSTHLMELFHKALRAQSILYFL